MPQRIRTIRVAQTVALSAAAFLICAAASFAQSSGGGMELHANGHTTAAEIGLPTYPGATLSKDSGNDSAVDMGFTFGDVHFKMLAANYTTTASPAQVFAFYRKPLSHYGEVLECDRGKPVGSLTVASTGLTCSDKGGNHVQVNGSADSSSDHELRAGSPHQFRLIGIDTSRPGATRFGLVYLELPKDTGAKDKSE